MWRGLDLRLLPVYAFNTYYLILIEVLYYLHDFVYLVEKEYM